MVFEAHCMSFPCTDVLIIQLCQGKDSFPFYDTFNRRKKMQTGLERHDMRASKQFSF